MVRIVSGVWRVRAYKEGGYGFDRLIGQAGWCVTDETTPKHIARRLLKRALLARKAKQCQKLSEFGKASKGNLMRHSRQNWSGNYFTEKSR